MLLQWFRRIVLAAALLPALAGAAPDDLVTVLYVNGVATNAAQAAADRQALRAALESATLRPAYPQRIEVENAYNPTNGIDADVAELVALKLNEESYLADQWAAFRTGSDSPEVLAPEVLAALYDTALPRDPATIRGVAEGIVATWTPRLAVPGRQLVLVGHSQGNFIVNWALLGLLRALGPAALEKVRVVNVASSTAWSPFGLDVTLDEDAGVFSFLANKGLGEPRDTPFCRSAGLARGCTFRTATATLAANTPCTTPLAAAAAYCHNFRASYLSPLPTTTIDGQRLASAVFVREGERLSQRLVDTVFSAIDSLEHAVPPGWQDDLFGAYFGHGASAPAAGAIRLAPGPGQRAAAVGKASFDQGVAAHWRGCLPAPSEGDNWIAFDRRGRDGLLPPALADQAPVLFAIGFVARADQPGTLQAVFGRDAGETETRSARPRRSAGGFCGEFSVAIGEDGFGSVQFHSAAGGQPMRFRSRAPIAAGVKRLHLSAFGALPLDVEALEANQQAFAPPFR